MYKIFITLRYLRARLITYLATVLVAIGVMVFIVVLSVMTGFQAQFKERIRGTLSHMSFVRHGSGATYEAMEEAIRKDSRVEAVAPRMRGLSLIGSRQNFEGAEIYGIDIEKEYEVGGLRDYLLTNTRLYGLDLDETFKSVREPEMTITLLGWEPVEEDDRAAVLVFEEKLTAKLTKVRVAGFESSGGLDVRKQRRWLRVADIEGQGLRIRGVGVLLTLPEVDKQKLKKESDDPAVWARFEEFLARYAELHEDKDTRQILDLFDSATYDRYGLQLEDPWAPPPGVEITDEGFRPILIGIDLRRTFGLRRGSTIAITTGVEDKATGDLEPRKWIFTVVGFFKTGMVEWDQRTIYARIEDLMDGPDRQGFLGRGEVDEISVKLHRYQDAEAVQADMSKEYPDWLVRTWEDQRGNLLKAVELEKIVMGIILFMIVLLAVVTIMVVLILLVNEKTKDIGILRALGATRAGIVQVILTNGFVIGLVGSVIGAILGVVFVLNINGVEQFIHDKTGWTLYPRDVYYLDKIPDQVDPFDVMATIVITLCLCLVLGFYPAWLAARLDPVEAFHRE